MAFFFGQTLIAQEIRVEGKASASQIYKKTVEAENALSFNDLDIEFGYVLYQTEITTHAESEELELETVRDYAVVYVDGKLQGTLTDHGKTLIIKVDPGQHTLQFYVENIGRITYGPEITDNSKGLFGTVSLAGNELQNWKMTPLAVRDYPLKDLVFERSLANGSPGFYQALFEHNLPENKYLNMTGWGMGEVWLNHNYLGSYWEEEKQQSILIPSEYLISGKNELVIFELKNNQQKKISLSPTAVFK
jgi:beta-galactosidase